MGEGLKRATLATLCSRGPWTVDGKEVTGSQVQALYAAIPDVSRMAAAVGGTALSDRACDRVLQLLKKAGLVHFSKVSRAWERT